MKEEEKVLERSGMSLSSSRSCHNSGRRNQSEGDRLNSVAQEPEGSSPHSTARHRSLS
jgi:hypothetical protein